MRRLTRANPDSAIQTTVQELRRLGVVLCFIPAVPGLGIHGATRWLKGNPVVQLSLLWRSDDQLWFTLFHEIAHVLLHGDRALYVNGESTAEESEADQWASDTLIPPRDAARLPLRRDLDAVQTLARELDIAPSIVLGRAQRITKDYGWGHGLKRKFEFVAE